MKDKIRIKANNSDGFYFLESGGGINLSYPESKSRRGRVIEEGRICPTITTGGESIGIMEKVQHIRIKTYNSDEFCYLESGGVLNISYPNDRTKRGRVKERGHICPTIPINDNNIGIMEKTTDSYKIRRLTPRECYRLMGVKDEDINKMLAINSETQCYKQAGNSIVVPVLEAIFRRMFIDTEPIKGEQMDISDFL